MEELEERTHQQVPAEPPKGRGRNLGKTIGIILAVIVVLAILGGIGYGLVSYPLLTAVIRDIAIIALAVVTLVIGAFLAILIFQLQSLIALLRDEIKPILESANETASTVRGTTSFVSDAMVKPMITTASYVSAVRQTIKVLAGRPRRDQRQHSSPEK